MALCSALCTFVSVAASLLVLVYCTTMLCIYTPLYRPVVCKEVNSTRKGPTLGDSIEIEAWEEMACTSPNPYDLRISFPEPSRLFIWPELVEIGHVYLDGFDLPENTKVTIPSYTNMSISWDTAGVLATRPASDVIIVSPVDAVVDVALLPGIKLKHSVRTTYYCGLQMLTGVEMTAGDIACGGTREDVLQRIPAVEKNNTGPNPFYAKMHGGPLGTAQVIMNTICGIALGAAVTTLLALVVAWRMRHQKEARTYGINITAAAGDSKVEPEP